jgi:hypothetical protein
MYLQAETYLQAKLIDITYRPKTQRQTKGIGGNYVTSQSTVSISVHTEHIGGH